MTKDTKPRDSKPQEKQTPEASELSRNDLEGVAGGIRIWDTRDDNLVWDASEPPLLIAPPGKKKRP